MRLLIAAALLLCTTSALATTVRETIDQARELEAELKYDIAGELLLQAIADERATDDELMEANLRAGIVQRIIDNDVDSRLHFGYVLQRDPSAQLPEGMPPKISAFFELIRKQVLDERSRDRDRDRDRDPVTPVAPAPAPDPGNPTLFWTGAGLAGTGAVLMVTMTALAAVGELTYLDPTASVIDRSNAQDVAPLMWAGAAAGAALTVVGTFLLATN